MMHGCASVSEAPRRRTHSVVRHESHAAARGRPPPRTVIGDPLCADRAENYQISCQLMVIGSRVQLGAFDHAGRMTIPSGTTPSCTSPHKAMSSLRASATIMVLREALALAVRSSNHLTSGLSF